MKRYIKSSTDSIQYYAVLVSVNNKTFPLCFEYDASYGESELSSIKRIPDNLISEVMWAYQHDSAGSQFPELFDAYGGSLNVEPDNYTILNKEPINYSGFGKVFIDTDYDECFDEAYLKSLYKEVYDKGDTDAETYEEYYENVTSKNGPVRLMKPKY